MDSTFNDLTNLTTPDDADLIAIEDISETDTSKLTWANLKATLKTYFDTLYGGTAVNGEALGGSGVNRTLAQTPIGVVVICDGAVILHPTTDYTRTGTAVTFVIAPDDPRGYYRY
jgi:hypothetical protein